MSDITYKVLVDWSGNGVFTGAGEDVTSRVLAEVGITAAYGRDQNRAGTPTRPGVSWFTLNNRSRDYSPENTSSPLNGLLGPGREVIIQATYLSVTYALYRGFLDDYDVLPNSDERAVKLTCIDALGKLANTDISTGLYQGIRTGTAIGLILDAAGWPAGARDLGVGATVIPWWWEEGTTAGPAIEKVLNSEGITATAFVGTDGTFVFRDRHARILDTASNTSQATFRATIGAAEPLISIPLVYDAGWRDIINSVVYQVDERRPGPLAPVWESDAVHSIAASQSITVNAESSDPFQGAVTPVEDVDYTVNSGTVTVSLIRDSGQAAGIVITAGGSGAVVSGLQLRAYPVPVIGTVQVKAEDSASITQHGRRSNPDPAPWVNRHDALALATILLAHRAKRMPVVSMRIISKTQERILQQLGRDLLDRIHIIEPEIGIDADFWIEQIEHKAIPNFHETVFGCEKIPSPPLSTASTIFRFDTSGQGFDQGLFGY